MISKANLEKMAATLGGTMILGIIKGTPCDQAGMRYGDILLKVNGQPVPNWQAFVDAKELRTDGMDILYYRNGQEVSTSISFTKLEVNTTALAYELADMRII